MNIKQARSLLKDSVVFNLAELRLIEPNFRRATIAEWKARGEIQMIAPGYYIFSDSKLDEPRLFEIANRIYEPSYISLETALSYYELIPETVFAITSVGTRKTRCINSPIGRFIFHSISPPRFFGYSVSNYEEGHKFLMVDMEKALLDTLYFHPHLIEEEDFRSLRLDPERVKKLDLDKMENWAPLFHQKALMKRARALIDYICHA